MQNNFFEFENPCGVILGCKWKIRWYMENYQKLDKLTFFTNTEKFWYQVVCNIYICIFRQHFFVNANFIKHNRHFMSTYFLLDPFEFPYYFYRILGELIYVLSIVVCIPSTFCPTLGHHQSRAESTRDTYNYGQYINQFPQNTIKVIREFERIQKKICRHKMSIMFNEIYI